MRPIMLIVLLQAFKTAYMCIKMKKNDARNKREKMSDLTCFFAKYIVKCHDYRIILKLTKSLALPIRATAF